MARRAISLPSALPQSLDTPACIRRLADWLARRPQLGREGFVRGAAKALNAAHAAIPAGDLTGLLRACLAVLLRTGQVGRYRPPPLLLWRVPEALARLRRLLPKLIQGVIFRNGVEVSNTPAQNVA